jgi:hypothetical protein
MAEITLVAAFSTVPGGEADAIYTDTHLTLGEAGMPADRIPGPCCIAFADHRDGRSGR